MSVTVRVSAQPGRDMTEARTDRILVDMLEVLELPLRPRRLLVPSPLPLLVLSCAPQTSAVLVLPSPYNDTTRTSILLFSRLAVSKSPVRMPVATFSHNRLLSNGSAWFGIGLTVTSSLGERTFVNSRPVRLSRDVLSHWPSKG